MALDKGAFRNWNCEIWLEGKRIGETELTQGPAPLGDILARLAAAAGDRPLWYLISED